MKSQIRNPNPQTNPKPENRNVSDLGFWSFIGLPRSERGAFYYWGHWDLGFSHSRPRRVGFSLLEIIVAIGIIASAIFALTSLNLKSGEGATEATLRYQATSLAREGIEVVRARRDSNWLAGCPDPAAPSCIRWNSGLVEGTDYTMIPVFDSATNNWSFDFGPDAVGPIVVTGSDLMVQGSAGGRATAFSRLIELWPICRAADGIETVLAREGETCPGEQSGIDVRARTTFRLTGGDREVVVEERLYNWR